MAINAWNAHYPRGSADTNGVNVDTGCRNGPVAGGSQVRHSHNLVSIMNSRGFRRLLGIRLTSQAGDGLFQAGLAGSVLFNPQQAASPMAIAAAFAVVLLPYSLIGPYLGVLIDRWSRRTVMTVTAGARASLVIPTAVLIWNGTQGMPFMILTLLIIGLGRLFLAACSAALPHVVEDQRLVTANAAVNTLGSLAYSLGLGVVAVLMFAGLPVSFHGYAAAALLAPVGYLAAALSARWAFNETALGPDTPHHEHLPLRQEIAEARRETIDGFRHIARRRVASSLLTAQSAHRILYGILALVVTLQYRSAFTDGGDLASTLSGLGGACVAAAFGSLLAAAITPVLARRIGGGRSIIIFFVLTGIVVAAFGSLSSSALLPIAVGWVALASQVTKIVVDTALQHECEDDFRGRAFSINDTLFNLCFVLGTYLGALTMPSTGHNPVVTSIVALAYIMMAIWLAVFMRRAEALTTRTVVPAARDGLRPRIPVASATHESRWASAR